MVSLQRVGSLPPVNGGANRDGPDLSWKDWVTVPRQGAVKVRRETRALSRELRFCRTLKYASGMTSTRWRAAAHYATGRLHSRFAGNARLSAAASFGCPEQGPRLRSAACRKRSVCKTWARTGNRSHGAHQAGPRGEQSLMNVPEVRTRHNRYSNREQPILTDRNGQWQARR